MGTGYEVTIKCVSGTTTVATSDTIDASAANRSLAAGEVETYVVNAAAGAYLVAGRDRTKFDTISEETAANGVAIDGLTIKDSGFELGSDAEGDIHYVDSVLALRRLGIGTAGQSLKVNAGATAPEWGAAPFVELYESTGTTAITGSARTYSEAHGLTGVPRGYGIYLVCVTDDKGFVAGDEIDFGSMIGASTQAGQTWANATDAGFTAQNIFTTSITALMAHKTTGTLGSVTLANWEWKIRAWY